MSESEQKNSLPKFSGPLFIAWGLTPAMFLVATCLWLGPSGIPGVDSADFPGPHLKFAQAISLLVLFPWSLVLVRDRVRGPLFMSFAAIAVTLVAFVANVLLALSGCAVVDLTSDILAFD